MLRGKPQFILDDGAIESSTWGRRLAVAALVAGLFGVAYAWPGRMSWDVGHWPRGFSSGVCIALLALSTLLRRHRRVSLTIVMLAFAVAIVEFAGSAGLIASRDISGVGDGGASRLHAMNGATSLIAVLLLCVGMQRIRVGRIDLGQLSIVVVGLIALVAIAGQMVVVVFPALSAPTTVMPTATAFAITMLSAALVVQNPGGPIHRILGGTDCDSLTLKIAGPLVALLIVMVGGVSWVFLSSVSYSVDGQLTNEAHLAMSSLRGVFAASSTDDEAQRGLDEMLRAGRVVDAVVVNARTQRVVVCSNRDWIGLLLNKLPWDDFAEEIWTAIESGKGSIDTHHRNDCVVDMTAFVTRPRAEGSRAMSSEESTSDGMVAMLHIKADEIRYRTASQIRQLGVVAAAVALITFVFAAALVRRRLLNRVFEISDAIELWSGGDTASRVCPGPMDELGRIGGSLNAMLDTVDAQRQQISLLATVSRRTTNAVVITDVNNHIVWANDAFTRMSGYEPSEYATKTLNDVAFFQRTDADSVSRLSESMAAHEGIRLEILLRGKHGHEYWVDLDAQPMWNDDHDVDGFVIVQTDIDARKTAEIELDRVRGHLYTAIETIDATMIMFDKDARFVMCNSKYRSAGFVDARLLVSGTPFDAISEAFYGKFPHLIEGRSMEQCVTDELAKFRDGETSWTVYLGDRYIRLASRRTPDGGFVCLGTDVTELELMNTELNAAFEAADSANRMKTEFLANMSHEIRTPMSAILGYAEMLGEDESVWSDSNKRRHSLEVIERSGDHLLTIINDILDLSKIEAGKMTIERIQFDPAKVVDAVCTLHGVNARAKNIELQVVHEPPIPRQIRSDPVRMQQVISNLVSNAIKFTKVGGVQIVMGMDSSDATCPWLRIVVKDTGIGMSVEQISRLFNAFEQAEASTSRRYGGTGLGLRISKRLAELMGGTIGVQSHQGAGSEFTLSLPVGTLDAPADRDESESANAASFNDDRSIRPSEFSLTGKRILLMEDGPDNQKLISHFLTTAGATVTIAENGRDGLSLLTSNGAWDGPLCSPSPFDLILSDVQMPELDGYAAARVLRQKGFGVPILVLTADAMAGTADRCREAGCDGFLSKPVSRASLIAACSRAINARRANAVQPRD